MPTFIRHLRVKISLKDWTKHSWVMWAKLNEFQQNAFITEHGLPAEPMMARESSDSGVGTFYLLPASFFSSRKKFLNLANRAIRKHQLVSSKSPSAFQQPWSTPSWYFVWSFTSASAFLRFWVTNNTKLRNFWKFPFLLEFSHRGQILFLLTSTVTFGESLPFSSLGGFEVFHPVSTSATS